MKKLIALVCITIPLVSQAHEHAAHVHGAAEIDVAIEGKKLLITLESPADNLLGFERAPKTEAEKAKLKAVTEQLNQAATLFVPDAAAQCKAATPVVNMPSFKKGEHSDIDAEYSFDCQSVPSSVALSLWKNFPNFKKLNANLATAKGQKQLSLKPGQDLSLK
ncbi:DUF2796 domain-containing protein [Chitinibacter fontanus]|uniref:DUF2796 domain-containing protein n=1 Tax=Chitinibacter fontanus TaxID=1737446 RepID=A0A7D5V8X6_9NEIS|nr:DUF2796 domain-containing protein [Chitinibacter fontanus]QLI81051.1 DUF2796 domain-containing protein [Chitinibacter fontanus]